MEKEINRGVDIMENIGQIEFELKRYETALSTGLGVGKAKERLMNVLFNARNELVEAAKEGAGLHEQVDALNAALADADETIRALKARRKPGKAEAREAAPDA
jgi:hypothetical protein